MPVPPNLSPGYLKEIEVTAAGRNGYDRASEAYGMHTKNLLKPSSPSSPEGVLSKGGWVPPLYWSQDRCGKCKPEVKFKNITKPIDDSWSPPRTQRWEGGDNPTLEWGTHPNSNPRDIYRFHCENPKTRGAPRDTTYLHYSPPKTSHKPITRSAHSLSQRQSFQIVPGTLCYHCLLTVDDPRDAELVSGRPFHIRNCLQNHCLETYRKPYVPKESIGSTTTI